MQEGFIERDFLIEVERFEALIECLHARIAVIGIELHGGIDLVNFIFAYEVSDSVIGEHDFVSDAPSVPGGVWQELLTDDGF